MKRILGCFLLLTVMGCASITIPSYIRDTNPYRRIFYASFDRTREETRQVLSRAGWAIEKETEPELFERERISGENKEQTLLFTEIRQSYFFIGSGYSRMNIFLREKTSHETEVEVRYVRVTSMMFKSFYGYRNDPAVNHILRDIEQGLDVRPSDIPESGS